MMIRNMEGRETALRYDQLMESTNRILTSDTSGKFRNVNSIHTLLGELADVSRDPATFRLATTSVTKMLAEGRVDSQHIREFAVDTGYNLSTAMAKALKMTPEQLADALKKHKLTGATQVDVLLKALEIITGPGGPAYQHAKSQLDGLTGVWNRFLGHCSTDIC